MELRKMKDRQLLQIDYLKNLIDIENMRQVEKWGIQNVTPFEWLTYTFEEFGEAAAAISEYEYRGGQVTDVIKELVQAVTLLLKIAEMYMYEPTTKPEPPINYGVIIDNMEYD